MVFLYFFVSCILAYILGSIPFGIIIGKHFKGIDIRDVGSGNIGTANAYRALGPLYGTLVLLGDVLKGSCSCFIASILVCDPFKPYAVVLAGIISIIGHNNSVFLKFKGGKGIATSLGVIVFLNWKISLICIGIWVLTIAITKYSSLGSLLGIITLPILMYLFKEPLIYVIFSIVAAIFAIYKHKANIKRLLKGEELKITQKQGKMEKEEKGKEG